MSVWWLSWDKNIGMPPLLFFLLHSSDYGIMSDKEKQQTNEPKERGGEMVGSL